MKNLYCFCFVFVISFLQMNKACLAQVTLVKHQISVKTQKSTWWQDQAPALESKLMSYTGIHNVQAKEVNGTLEITCEPYISTQDLISLLHKGIIDKNTARVSSKKIELSDKAFARILKVKTSRVEQYHTKLD